MKIKFLVDGIQRMTLFVRCSDIVITSYAG